MATRQSHRADARGAPRFVRKALRDIAHHRDDLLNTLSRPGEVIEVGGVAGLGEELLTRLGEVLAPVYPVLQPGASPHPVPRLLGCTLERLEVALMRIERLEVADNARASGALPAAPLVELGKVAAHLVRLVVELVQGRHALGELCIALQIKGVDIELSGAFHESIQVVSELEGSVQRLLRGGERHERRQLLAQGLGAKRERASPPEKQLRVNDAAPSPSHRHRQIR